MPLPRTIGTGRALRAVQPPIPASISGLTLWLKADALSLSDGAPITSWPDASGNGYTATQATGTKQPTFKTAIQNGRPVARFDGGDALITPTVDFQSAGALTMYFVVKHSAGATDHMYMEASAAFSSNNGSFIFYRQGSDLRTNVSLKSSTGTPTWRSYRQPSTSRFQIVSAIVDLSLPNVAGFTQEFNCLSYQDGMVDNGTNGNGKGNTTGTPTFANNILYIGARNQSNTFFTGDMGEILLYRGRHTAAQQRKIYDYLNAKWGITYTHGMIAYIGDSMTAGTNTTSSYPLQTDALLIADGFNYNYGNYGRNGTQSTEMAPYAASVVDPLIGMNSGKNIAVCWGGTNDLFFGATVSNTMTNVQALCAARKAAGWKVIALTMLPRSDAGAPGSFETSRTTFNTWLRANYTTFADALYDCAADTRIGDSGDELDLTYYTSDKVHLNSSAGQPIIAAGVKTAIEAL